MPGPMQLLVILIIVILLFGTKRLKNIGADLGSAFKGFKKAINEDEEEKTQSKVSDKSDPSIIEGEVIKEDKKDKVE